jgi:hypothetical protein
MNHKGFLKIGIIILVVVLVGVLASILWPKKTVAPEVPVSSNPSTGSAGSPQASSGNTVSPDTFQTFQGTFRAFFEGWNNLTYEFSYPPENFSVSSTPGGNSIVIRDLKTGKETDIKISYEGARGYTPGDYFESVVKAQCASCKEIARQIGIPGAKIYGNGIEEWLIFPEKFALFAAHIFVPADSIEQVLSTLRVVDVKTQQPGPQP